jgi:mono/diheme cytochrome c family protein
MVPRMKTPISLRAFGARPIWAVAVVVVVFTLGNALLVGCGGGSSQQSSSSSTQAPATSTPSAAPTTTGGTATADDALGAKVYSEKCSVCHGPNGKGDGPGGAALNPKPRDHTNGAYMNARTDDELLNVIRNGKGAMPAWKDVLTDQEQHAVLKHVRTLAVPPYPGQS